MYQCRNVPRVPALLTTLPVLRLISHNFLRRRALSLFVLDRATLLGHLYVRNQRSSASLSVSRHVLFVLRADATRAGQRVYFARRPDFVELGGRTMYEGRAPEDDVADDDFRETRTHERIEPAEHDTACVVDASKWCMQMPRVFRS
ncbi:hypothetical protein EXIGLDRAFT_412086 [Exidia glandulosa HHB12029]|uniref:Uncharacterized protein n=1 Tax=Exidia glandulosa HHB12029 TaxID=1314781 RepID=A0A165BFH6_EXIGL|nr:hypothetical protein EXIGLDRAFT_412086 [Exidia glandulosa HHB12029]